MVMRGMGAAQKRRRRVVGEKWEQQEESCPAPTGLVAPGFPLDQDHSAEHWDHRRVNRRRLNCEGLGPQRLDRQQLEHQQGLGPQGLGHKGWDQLERDQEEAGRTGQFRDQVQKLESHQRDDVIRCGQGLDQQQPGQELDVQVEGRELERDRDRDRAESRDRDRDPPFKIFRVLEELGQPHVYAFHVIMPARQPSWKEIVRALQQGFSTFLVQMDTTLLHKGNLTAGVPSPLTQSVAQQQFRNWCSIQQPGGQLTLTFIQAAYAAVIEMHRTQSASWPRALLSDFFQFFIQKGIGALRDCTAGNLSTEIQRDSESALFASIFFVSHTLLALEGKNADSRDAKGATKSAGFKASHTSTVITGGDDRCVQNILELKFQATGFLCKSLEGMYDHPGVFQFEDVRRAQDLILMVAMEMVLGLSQRLATDGSINGVQGKSARRDLLKPLLMGILGGPFLKCMPDPTSVNPNSKSSERASKCPRPSDAGKVKMVMETFQALKNLWSRRRQTLAFMVDLISHIMEHNRLAGFSFLMQVVKIVKTTLSTSTAGSCPEAASQDEIEAAMHLLCDFATRQDAITIGAISIGPLIGTLRCDRPSIRKCMVDISFVYLRQCTLKGILIAAEGVCFVLRVLKLMLCDRDASVRLRVLCNLLSLMTDCGVAVTFRKFLLSPGRMCNEDDCPHDQAVKSFLDVLIQRLEDKSKAVRIKSLSLFELMVSETRSMIPIMPLQTKKTGVEPSTPSKEDCKPVENCLGHSEEAATNFHLLQVVEFIQWMLLQMLPLFRLLLALPCNSPFFCDETVELIGRLLCSARAHLVGQASMMIHRQNPQQVTLPFLRTFAADRCKTIAGELQCFFCQTYVSDVAKSVVRRILQAYFGGGFRSWRSFLSLCSEKNLSKIAELLQDVGRSAHCKAEWESRGSTKGKGGGGTLKGTSEEAKMAQEREQDGKNRLRRAAESFAVQALSMLVDIAHGCARPGPKPYHSEPMSARRWNKGSPDATNLGPLTQSSRDRGLRPEDSAYEGLVLGCLVTIGVLGDAKQHRERAASSVICSPARQTSAWSIDLLHSLQLRPRENIRALIYIIRQLARTLASGIQHSGRGEGGGGMGIDRSSGQTAELQSIAFHYDDQEDPAGLQLSPDARHSTEFRSIEWALKVMSMIVSANLMDEEAIAVIDAEGFIGDQFINLFPYFRGAVIDLLFSIKDPVTAVKKILRTYELKLGVLSGPAKVGMVRQYLQFLGDTARIYEIAQESFQQRLKDAQKKIRSGQGRRDASSCTESQGLEGREGGDVQRSSQQIFRSLMHEDFDYMCTEDEKAQQEDAALQFTEMLVDGQSLPGCYIPFLAQLAAQANSSASSNWKSPSMKSSGSVPKDRSGSEDHSGSEEDRLGLKEDSSKSQIPPGLQAVALTSLASFLALCPKAACEHKHLVQKALSSNQHNEVKLAGLKAAAKLALCAPNEYLPVFKLVEDLVQQSANDDNSKAEHANCKRSISASQAGKHCNETEARQKEKAHPSGVDMTINRYRTLPEFSTEAYRAIAELLLQGRLKAESYLGFVGNGIADSHPGIQRLMVHTLQRLLEMSGKGRIKMVVDLHTQTRASCRKRLVAQLVGNLQFLGKRRETACDSGTRIRRNPKAGSAADIRDMDSNCRSATGVDSNFSAVLTQQDLRSDELAALLLQKLCAGQSDVAFFLSFVTPSKRALLTLEANVQATPPKLCVRSLDPLALDDLMQFVSNAQHAKRGTTESAGGGTNVNMVDAEDSAMPASTLRQLSANIMRLLRKERSMATDHRHSSRSSKGATQIGMDFLKRKREQHDTTTTQKMQKKDEDGDWGVQFGNAVKGINVNDDNRESLGREKDHPDEELTEGNGNLQGGAPGNRQQLVIDHYVKAVEGFKKKPDMEMRIADILREV